MFRDNFMRFRLFIVLFVILMVLGIAFVGFMGWKPPASIENNAAIHIDSVKINSIERFSNIYQSDFTCAQFKTGFFLESSESSFGGWSGLAVSPDKKTVYFVSDNGQWLTGRLEWEGRSIAKISDAQLGSLRNQAGKSLRSVGGGDIEAIAVRNRYAVIASESPKTRLYISKKWQGYFGDDFVAIDLPDDIAGLPKGRGIESLFWLPDEPPTLIAIAERNPLGGGRIPLWKMTENDFGVFKFERGWIEVPDGYDVSDAAYSEKYGMLVLLRKVRWNLTFGVALLQIDASKVKESNYFLQGKILFETDSLWSRFGNMEGLVVLDDEPCGVLMLEDDNFLFIQKTKLIQMCIM